MLDFGFGYILGNTFDAWSLDFPIEHDENWETAWCAPKTTQEIIKNIKDAGFKTIKIPVTWNEHFTFNSTTKEIKMEEMWINRIDEVIGYILDAGCNCLVSSHHDAKWIERWTPEEPGDIEEKFLAMWKWLANHWKDYPTTLAYEESNELGFSLKDQRCIDFTNHLNHEFVKIVREADGNKDRTVLIESYFGSHTISYDFLEPVIDDKNCVVGVHFYDPWMLTIAEPGMCIYT